MKKLAVLLSFLIFGAGASYAIEDNVFYLHDCLEIAVKNSPLIKKAKYNFEISKDDLSIAKAVYFPTLGAGIAYRQFVNSTNNFDDGYTKRNLPDVSVYLRQLIFDFGKTSANIDMKKFYRLAAEYEYNDSICDTINAVKVAYFNALEAKAAVEIQENNLMISEMILEHTKELYENGKKKETDYINAKVYVTTAKMMLEDARNLYYIAMCNLSNAMYSEDFTNAEIKNISEFNYVDAYFTPEFTSDKTWRRADPLTGGKHEKKEFRADFTPLPFTLKQAYEAAYERNPELKVLENTLDAMKQQALSVKRQYYPNLGAQVGYGYNGKYISQHDPIRNNQLNVLVSLDSSVNILQTKHEIDKVNYKVKSAENDIEIFKKNIYYEIKKAYDDVLTAERQIVNAKDKVKHSMDNLDSVANAYDSDSGNKVGYLELQNARQNYNQAKLDYISKLRIYNVSLARLEKATHIHTHGVHQFQDMHTMIDADEKKTTQTKNNKNNL